MALPVAGPAAKPDQQRGLQVVRESQAFGDVGQTRLALGRVGRGWVETWRAAGAGADAADLEAGIADRLANPAPLLGVHKSRVGVRRAGGDLDPVVARRATVEIVSSSERQGNQEKPDEFSAMPRPAAISLLPAHGP